MNNLRRVAVVFATGLALRLALIQIFPVIFGGDPMLRMMNRDHILISHQLPLPQLIVWALSRVSHDYRIIMVAMAIIGAAAGVTFYLLAKDLFDEPVALLAALLLTTNPMIAALSIV